MRVVDETVARLLPAVPRPVVQRLSAPYIAGATLEDACRVVTGLNAEGKAATVDVLGEEITSREEAATIAGEYRGVLAALAGAGLDANISVKLTALGLELDPALCGSLLAEVVDDAAARGRFVRIDMEDSTCTDDTLALYRELRARGKENVGIVLQAALKRTMADIADLIDLRPNVRLCKGIYVEPPDRAYRSDDAIRRSFVDCLDALLAGGSRVALATHDEWLLERSLARVGEGTPAGYEVQMLLGVRSERATELAATGHRVRIYVPFGRQWYAYSVRRLQENPRLAGIVARASLGRLVRR